MDYMLMIYSPEKAWTTEEWNACVDTSLGICQELIAKGQFITASPLHPVATATTVRVRDGHPLITSGPFAETAEQLGGYYLINVEDLDEAIAIASRLPAAKKGTVEIRPLMKVEGLPPSRLSPDANVDPELTKYMFLCYDDEKYWAEAGPDVHHSAMQEAIALTHNLNATGQYLSASPLHPSSIATSVRVRNGQRIVSDGPFAETSEVLGGFYVILARNQEEAVSFAAQHSGARVGSVEVREVFDVSQRVNA